MTNYVARLVETDRRVMASRLTWGNIPITSSTFLYNAQDDYIAVRTQLVELVRTFQVAAREELTR